MKSKKPIVVVKKTAPASGSTTSTTNITTKPTQGFHGGSLFERENIWWMLGGAIVMIIGFILMAGGRSEDPNVFNPNEVYSTTRITIAPILILIGLVIEIFAIFRNSATRTV
jgi:hypothetical protein